MGNPLMVTLSKQGGRGFRLIRARRLCVDTDGRKLAPSEVLEDSLDILRVVEDAYYFDGGRVREVENRQWKVVDPPGP